MMPSALQGSTDVIGTVQNPAGAILAPLDLRTAMLRRMHILEIPHKPSTIQGLFGLFGLSQLPEVFLQQITDNASRDKSATPPAFFPSFFLLLLL